MWVGISLVLLMKECTYLFFFLKKGQRYCYYINAGINVQVVWARRVIYVSEIGKEDESFSRFPHFSSIQARFLFLFVFHFPKKRYEHTHILQKKGNDRVRKSDQRRRRDGIEENEMVSWFASASFVHFPFFPSFSFPCSSSAPHKVFLSFHSFFFILL